MSGKTTTTTDKSTATIEVPGRTTPEIEYAHLVAEVKKNLPGSNLETVEKAYRFAANYHSHQVRKSGEPYITHPLAVAAIAASIKLDFASVIAAILHDTVEDTACTLEDIEKDFGSEVKHLVDGLTKISKIEFRSNQERLAENFRKMIVAMSKDLRVILIKLCDRLHNMRTIGCMSPEKCQRIAQETLDIYAPLANRLGVYNIKSELEDLCLKSLKYDIYQEIRSKIAAKKNARQAYIDEVKGILENELRKYGFKDIYVYGRPKHFFSIYKKMLERHLNFEDIHDLFAFRIIVNSVKDCYEALGVVHAMWKPMPGRFKDYIAMPKANMYQSLHTTVIRPNGEPAEIQIRTKEMHEICENGVAAHWAYKETDSTESMAQTDLQKFSWLRQIMQWQNELQDPAEFLEAVKVDLFDEEIFVFTPKGDVFTLPHNASALDFAFAVHTDVGLKTIGAKVNNRLVPIKKTLSSGDIVEILTSPNQRPSKDWLSFVITSKARNKIRSYLRSEQREKSRKLGSELLEQALDHRGLDLETMQRSGDIEKLTKNAKEANLDDFLIAIGYGKVNLVDLLARNFPEAPVKESITDQVNRAGYTEDKKRKAENRKQRQQVLVSGYEDVLVNFGRCCCPIPGEEIVGFITRGKGVTVHRSACARALDSDPARRIDVKWSNIDPTAPNKHRSYLSIITQDKPGVLADVTSKISEAGANVQKAEAKVSKDLTGVLEFELGVKDLAQLERVIKLLENIPAVVHVRRRTVLRHRRLRRGHYD